MIARSELHVFCVAVACVLAVPLIVAPVAGFGGLEGMARLFREDGAIVVPVSLRSGLRAITFLFITLVPLVIWSLRDLTGRADVFRIVVACGFLAGFARLTGYLVEGYPGAVPMVFLFTELVGMPLLWLWHARLVRLAKGTP